MKSVCLLVQMVYDIDVRVRRKAEALVAAGYSVDVMALRPPGGKKNYTLNGVNVRTVSLGKKRGSLARYFLEYALFFLWACVQTTMCTWRKRYAAIDVNTLPDFLIFAPFLAKLLGTKLVLDMHEITPEFYMSKYGMTADSWVVKFLTYIERFSFQFADQVITINQPIEDLLVGRGLRRSKSTIIMNAADESRFATAPKAAERDEKKFVMMYHGTLTPIYGLDIAIEAFSLVHDVMPGAELWILGTGTEEKALNELIERRGLVSKVKMVGQVPGSEIPSWLTRCDAGILPIRRDVFLDFAFPNKLPEFIIMGKSVIVARLNAIRYYFSDAALEYFEPNSPADLSRSMLRLYGDPVRRAELALRAKDEYVPIRWDVMKQRYVALINRLSGIVGSETEMPTVRGASLAAK